MSRSQLLKLVDWNAELIKPSSRQPTFEVINYYNQCAQVYSDAFKSHTADHGYADLFLDRLPVGSKVLDAGCGNGRFTKYIFNQGFHAEGIDLAIELLFLAKMNFPEGAFRAMDIAALKYPDRHFEGVFASYSLIHTPKHNVSTVLSEFYRVLKPGGLVFLSLQKGEGEAYLESPFTDKKVFMSLFTELEILRLIEKEGFQPMYTSSRPAISGVEIANDKLYVIARK